jgi:hypothetical protein
MNLTGYYVLDGRIRGPRRDGEFWIANDRILSADDPAGTYVINGDGRIDGPDGHTAFRIDRASGHIVGPHHRVPWLPGAEEDQEKSDALGG